MLTCDAWKSQNNNETFVYGVYIHNTIDDSWTENTHLRLYWQKAVHSNATHDNDT